MARTFNGSSDYLNAAGTNTLNVPFPLALGIWVNAGVQGNFKYLVSKLLVDGEHPSWGFATNGSGALRFLIGWGNAPGEVTVSPAIAEGDVFTSTWHHVLGTYDGTDVRIYLDGVEVSSGAPETRAIVYNNAKQLYVGNFDGTQLYYTGAAAELTLFNAIPDAATRAALAAGFSPRLTSLSTLATQWPLLGTYSPDIDLVGGVSLTVNGTTATAHPRLFEPSAQRTFPASVDVFDGTLTFTLPVPTADLTGELAFDATLGATLPVPTTDLTGELAYTAAAALTLPVPTTDLTGDLTFAATLALTLPVPTADVTGFVDLPTFTVTTIGVLQTRWQAGTLTNSDGANAIGGMVQQSAGSRIYVQLPVTAYIDGQPFNPEDPDPFDPIPVEMAFVTPGTTTPSPGDWVTGSWAQNAGGTWLAQALVGPGGAGATALAVGLYAVFVRITAPSQETPVFSAQQLLQIN